MRKLLLNPTPLFRKLRQLSMLLTLLLALPQTAMGATETVTKTITLNKSVSETIFPEGQDLTWGSITLPVTITENSITYDGQITIGSASINSYSSDTNGAVFKMKGNNASSSQFYLEVPGNYPATPSQATVKAAYSDAYATNGASYFNIELDESLDAGNTYDYKSTLSESTDITATFTADGNPRTNRSSEGPLYVWFTIRANWDLTNQTQTTVTVKEITITYEREDYGLTIGNTVVKSDNRTDILGDGKVSFTPAATVNDINVLTLNGANIEITTDDAIKSTMSAPLYVNIVGDNTISCNGHYAFNASNHLTFQTSGTTSGSLTITNTSGVTPSTFYSLPTDVTPTYENSLGAEQSGTNTVIISTAATTPSWPDAATDDNGAITVGAENDEPSLTMNYAATTSYSFPLTVPSGSTVTYTSTVPSVATVASTGVVTILKAGTTKITATVNSTDYNYKLTVNKVTGTITMKNNLKLVYGGATAIPADLATTSPAADAVTSQPIPLEFTWTSLGDRATVDETENTITPNKLGAWGDQISVNFHDNANYVLANNVSAPTCSLTVVPPAPVITPVERAYTIDGDTTFIIDETKTVTIAQALDVSSALQSGHAAKLRYKIGLEGNPADYPEAGVSISSSCLLIAWVEVNNNAGNAIVKSDNVYASYVVREGPNLNTSYGDDQQTVKMGETLAAPTIGTSMASTPSVTWSSSNTAVATVDETTGLVNPVSASETPVTITASFAGDATYKAATASYNLIVTKGDAPIAFYYMDDDIQTLVDGNTSPFFTTYGEDYTTGPTFSNDENVAVTWNSSVESVATVNGSGVVTIVSAGTTVITATFAGNDYYDVGTASYTLTVKPSAPTLSLESGVYYAGQELTVTPTITGTDITTSLNVNGQAAALSATSTYTFSTAGSYAVSATTSYSAGGVAAINSEPTTATYIINNEPVFTATVGNNAYNDADLQTGDVSVAISVTNLQDNCTLMYYYGSDKSKAVAYEEAIVLKETTTLNAFVRYRNTDGPTVTYDSEPVSQTYTVKQEVDLTFDDDQNYKTYFEPNFSLNKPAGLKVYAITGVSGTSVSTTELDYIPQGVAVLLEKDGEEPTGGYVAETYTGAQGSFASNKLKYVSDPDGLSTTGDEYVLFNNEFVKATGTIFEGSCYLDLSGVAPSRGMYGIGDGSTAIDATLMNHEGTNNEEWYDLQGRRIQKPTKAGIYIVNGKKIVINNK